MKILTKLGKTQYVLLAATAFCVASVSAQAETLNEAIDAAISSHPDVKIANRNESAIKQEWVQAKAGYLPTVDLTLGTGSERSYNSTTRARNTAAGEERHRSLFRNEARLSVNQMLFDGFETNSNVCQQRARLVSASHNVDEVTQTTALRAIQAYLDVVRNQELTALAKDNLAKHDKYLRQIKSRTDGGRGSQADVRQATGRVALARANMYAAEGELRNAESTYLEVMGHRAENLKTSKAPLAAMPASLDEALARASENNPAILSAQSDIVAADAAHKLTKAAFYPRLDLEGEAAQQRNLDGIPGPNNEYSAMARIRYNLYRGGADKARKSERMERLVEAQDTLERDRRLIEENMYQAWSDFDTAKSRLAPLGQHVTSSEQTRKAYQSQFDIGQRTLLDLLDTEIELFNARTAYINGKYAVDFAVYDVLTQAGDLVQTVTSEEK